MDIGRSCGNVMSSHTSTYAHKPHYSILFDGWATLWTKTLLRGNVTLQSELGEGNPIPDEFVLFPPESGSTSKLVGFEDFVYVSTMQGIDFRLEGQPIHCTTTHDLDITGSASTARKHDATSGIRGAASILGFRPWEEMIVSRNFISNYRNTNWFVGKHQNISRKIRHPKLAGSYRTLQ